MSATKDIAARRVYHRDGHDSDSIGYDRHRSLRVDHVSSHRSRSRSHDRSRRGGSSGPRSSISRRRDSGDAISISQHNHPIKESVDCTDADGSYDQDIPLNTDRNQKDTASTKGTTRPSLPYIYQQAEFIRICTDLIRKCDCESQLRDFFSSLDTGRSIDLRQYTDAQVRKKFRHLGRALYLSREGDQLSKPTECNISLLDALEEKLPYIRQKADALGTYVRPSRDPEVNQTMLGKGNNNLPFTMNEKDANTLVSLREMHEQGFFVGYEDVHKEFISRHTTHDVWGKTPQQQLELMRSVETGKDDGNTQPWKVFDRKELEASSKIDHSGYDRLLESTKDFSSSFGPGKSYTSFI
ncbi:hypothetical protein BaOVIS_020130 [Babesia ovis]|uniref:Uncharacterized protein n=1 Tax=Babesia ovis TaxID=5869 RepID=A0A9W5TEG0_BABOV|nr:hypothetical protein BaOVIS_020130 [Babesia ovis]